MPVEAPLVPPLAPMEGVPLQTSGHLVAECGYFNALREEIFGMPYAIPIEQIHIVYDKVNKFSHVKVSMGMVERYPKVCIVFAVKVILAIAGNISHFQWDPMTAIRTRQDRLAISIVLSDADKNK